MQAITKEQKEAQKKLQDLKIKYLAEHTVEDMVYENGSALGMIFRELTRLKDEIYQLKNQLNGN